MNIWPDHWTNENSTNNLILNKSNYLNNKIVLDNVNILIILYNININMNY